MLQGSLDGADLRVLANAALPFGVETLGDYAYWTESSTGRIRRARLNGSFVDTLYQSPSGAFASPLGLAIDPRAKRIYWSNSQSYEINSVDLTGGNLRTFSVPGAYYPYALAIDAAGGQLFWTEVFQKRIYRANLDGSNPQVVVQDTGAFPTLFGLTVDPVDQKIYWSNSELDAIRRANFDGSAIETIVSGPVGSTFRGVDVDEVARQLYWIDDRKDLMEVSYVMRADLDGANIQNLATIVGQSNDVAIGVPEPSTSVLAVVIGAALVSLTADRRKRVPHE